MKDGWDLGAVVEEREEGQGPTGHWKWGGNAGPIRVMSNRCERMATEITESRKA